MNAQSNSRSKFFGDRERFLCWSERLVAVLCLGLTLGCIACFTLENAVNFSQLRLAITPDEMERLIDSGNRWPTEVTRERDSRAQLISLARDAISCMNQSHDWKQTAGSVRSLAQANSVRMIDIQRGEIETGNRVTILRASCRMEGSYGSVCKTLHDFTTMVYPIWVSELDMQIGPPEVPVRATVQLRIPVIGSQTIAAYLARVINEVPSKQTLASISRKKDGDHD